MFATIHIIYALLFAAPFEEYVRSLYIRVGFWYGIACTAFFGLYELIVYTIRFWGDSPLSEILLIRLIVCGVHFGFWGIQIIFRGKTGLVAAIALHYAWNIYMILFSQ